MNDIPKGSRLAVSTNLLAALIGVLMRATGQAESLTGPLRESERRLVLARALLGEWIGGSGGGWQDSGGVWPGIKLIQGVVAEAGDPEHGISRGRLMPAHHVFDRSEISAQSRQLLQDSLVLVHGGMAQNVGPILEMVTEKYLLRSGPEWQGRQEALGILAQVLDALRDGDIARVGAVTTRNFQGPIQAIIPWASTYYTERLIEQVRAEFGTDFWGFWMLGGMSGGGMGFIFAPARKSEAQRRLQEIMSATKRELQHALPFAMDPVVYDFAINENGTFADLLTNADALMPAGYYALTVPELLRQDQRTLSPLRRAELDKFGAACRTKPELRGMVQTLFDAMLPRGKTDATNESLAGLLETNGFDARQHEQIRAHPAGGPHRSRAESTPGECRHRGRTRGGRGGFLPAIPKRIGKRAGWPPCKMARWPWSAWPRARARAGRRAPGWSRRCIRLPSWAGGIAPSWRRISPSRAASRASRERICRTSSPRAISRTSPPRPFSRRMPTTITPARCCSRGARAWACAWCPRSATCVLPGRRCRSRCSTSSSRRCARACGPRSSAGRAAPARPAITPTICRCNVCIRWGHWFEIPNLFRNGTLAQLLAQRPQLKTLLLHNIDTLGADVDPALLGQHLGSGAALTFEVITRRLEDRGGGLARVNGRPRLVEGLAMPREEAEFALTYYNTLTTWIDLDRLLEAFGLTREDFAPEANADEKITTAIRHLAAKMPTYVTLKDVKKRWGHGQEDIFPVTQFEKLWGDMTALPEIDSRFVVVPRRRGQQLKDQAQLDGWLRDGSAAYVESLCAWE
ncbi:MAG: UTP--glucose-1-phosphate uridylyltransferase [Chthoniobacter sp.]